MVGSERSVFIVVAMNLGCEQVPIHCGTNKGEAAKLKLLHARPFVSMVLVFACAAVYESLLIFGYSLISHSGNQSKCKDHILRGSSESKVQEDVHFVTSNYITTY